MTMHLAIAGGGLLGRLLAWQLSAQGHRVSVYERDSELGSQSAAYAAAAMLAPYSELIDADWSVFEYGLASIAVWKQWQSQLLVETGIDIALVQRGSLIVAHRNDRSLLEHFRQRLLAHRDLDADRVPSISNADLAQLEPDLEGRFREATFLSDEASLCNRRLLKALKIAADRYKVAWHFNTEVESVDQNKLTIQSETDAKVFDFVFDCRGFGAKQQAPGLRGVRGEVLWVKAPSVNLSRPVRLMHPRYQLYIAPKPDDVYVVGATEIESESLEPVTVRSALELQSALYSLHDGFGEATIIESLSNLRPAYLDNLPRIYVDHLNMQINGLYRHGYLLSPVVIKDALSLFAGINRIQWPAIVYPRSGSEHDNSAAPISA